MLKRKQLVLILPVLALGSSLSLGLGGCASNTNGTAQQKAQAQQMIQNAAGYLNPTSTTPTAVEGTWISNTCSPASTQGAQSSRKGYIFMGNSFYRQIDYFSSVDCSWDPSLTLAQARVYSDVAAGWFTITQGGSGYNNINMLAAPNFGNSYDLNIFAMQGSGQSGQLLMGDNSIDSTVRPTTLSITYTYWNTSTYGN
jgi:hypothetical protein